MKNKYYFSAINAYIHDIEFIKVYWDMEMEKWMEQFERSSWRMLKE